MEVLEITPYQPFPLEYHQYFISQYQAMQTQASEWLCQHTNYTVLPSQITPIYNFGEVQYLKERNHITYLFLLHEEQYLGYLSYSHYPSLRYLAPQTYSDQIVQIHELHILPHLRRQGLGSYLLRYLETMSKKRRRKHVLLEVDTYNQPAYKFYSRYRYRTVEWQLMGQILSDSSEPVIVVDPQDVKKSKHFRRTVERFIDKNVSLYYPLGSASRTLHHDIEHLVEKPGVTVLSFPKHQSYAILEENVKNRLVSVPYYFYMPKFHLRELFIAVATYARHNYGTDRIETSTMNYAELPKLSSCNITTYYETMSKTI